MPAQQIAYSVAVHFAKAKPPVHATYQAILRAARELGPVAEDPKKTSIHLVRGTAFAGVATRAESLILTLKANRALRSPRIHRAEQTSANRWHVEIRLSSPADVDAELRGWMAQAYELARAT